jgi:HPt (histidine-containing phosphotransfer) domain-containing protein
VDDAINPAALDAIRKLPGPNGPSLADKVIRAYLADAPIQLVKLHRALKEADAEALRKVSHAMKSSSANVGAEHLAGKCKHLEEMGRAGNVQEAASVLMAAELEFERVTVALTKQIEPGSEVEPGREDELA